MILTNFSATEVYGYLNFDITFSKGINFLVGVNGSGKTTVLRLIQALLTPSLYELAAIPFASASITFVHQNKRHVITSQKRKNEIVLTANENLEPLVFRNLPDFEFSYSTGSKQRIDVIEELQLRYAEHPTFQSISALSAPILLGLERTNRELTEYSNKKAWHKGLHIEQMRRGLRERRIVTGSLSSGLEEAQILLQEAYGRLKHLEDRKSDRLRETILLSAFRYESIENSEGIASITPDWSEQRKLLNRKNEISSALHTIGVSSDRMQNQLDDFFDKLRRLFESIDKSDESIPLEWVINKSQIERVADLIRIIDKHRLEIDSLFEPINNFVRTLNSFYRDTRKSISVDTVGQLNVNKPNKTTASIGALSSGERQLLIIFAHLLFNSFANRSNVFVIDEPELSLHLRWQEQFVQKVLEVSGDSQLILATHSPEIISGHEDKCISISQ